MNPRRQMDDTIAPEDGHDGQPERSTTDSAFDTAQSLLQAALEEVRTSRGGPVPPPAGADAEPQDGTAAHRHGRRRRHAGGPVEPEPSSTPITEDSSDPAEALDSEVRAPRRWRRPGADDKRRPVTALVVEVPSLEPESPAAPRQPAIEELDSEPGRARRRWRRPRGDDTRRPVTALVVEVPWLEPESPAAPRQPATAERVPEPAAWAAQTTAERVPEPSARTAETGAPTNRSATRPQPKNRSATRPQPKNRSATRRQPKNRSATRSRRRTGFVLVAALAVVTAAVATLATGFGNGESDGSARPPAHAAPEQARFAFDPVTTPEGMSVERAWVLQGDKGTRFVGKLSFSNPTSALLQTSYTEVIPKSLASSVDDIVFDPKPVVLQADPVVQYSVTVPAGEEVTARYEIQVAPDGVQQGRLAAWVNDLEAASQEGPTTTTTTTTSSTTTTTTAPPTTTTSAPPTSRPGDTSPTTAPRAAVPPAKAPPAQAPPAQAPAPPTPTGKIIIRAISVGGTGTFGFSGPGGPVSVTTSGSPDGFGQSAARTVPAGKYSWTEVSRSAGWGVPAIDCTDRDAGPFGDRSTVSGATATFNVQPGETVICTWTSRKA